MRRHEKALRRAFLSGYRAGRLHRNREACEAIDAEIKQFERQARRGSRNISRRCWRRRRALLSIGYRRLRTSP